MTITFLPAGKAVETDGTETILQAAGRAGVLIDASCAGAGKCGKCKVRIASGDAGALTDAENALLSDFEKENGYRLACCAKALGDLTVTLPGVHGGSGRKKSMARLPADFAPQTRIVSLHQKVAKATMKNQANDLGRVAEAFEKPSLLLAPGLLPAVHPALEEYRGDVTAVFCGDTLLSLEPGDSAEQCYGVAFDVGTTTVVGMLWDLKRNTPVDAEARTNDQSVHGADVISRIQFTMEAPENLGLIQGKVLRCCNEILETLYLRSHILPRHVYDVTVVGNTTMSHLFFGVTPRFLSRTPFAPVFCAAQDTQARTLGLNVNPQANVHLLPNIAGHVGSDIVGMLLAVRMDTLAGSHIAIDIGTNGEVVAIKNGRMVTCSTAAGPAFEGATIRHGMRAAPGAIERVEIAGGEVGIQTIDGLPPIGLCGSGLIDAVAQLLESRIVEPSGRMRTRDEALAAGISDALAGRLQDTADGLAFVLARRTDGESVTLTQQDVREVQLAKGAILAGILTLMKTLGMGMEEIDSILLAGAFGNYIRKESALRIGLFPQIPAEKLHSVGNAAGAGASMALLSDAARRHAGELALRTEHVELSMNPDFQDYYIDAMTFDIEKEFSMEG